MVTLIIKRSDEPKVIQLTQETLMKELSMIPGSEMLLEDTWVQGLRKVRTMYVCLVEPDCVLSASYLTSNYGIMKKAINFTKGGGNTSLVMMASCLGVRRFDNRIYNYYLGNQKINNSGAVVSSWQPTPRKMKDFTMPYEAQIGFVPGSIIRYTALKDIIDTFDWDRRDLVQMSTELSLHFWNTNRTLKVNPNTTYVSTASHLDNPRGIKLDIPDRVGNLFRRRGL
jgi:hypothetical protein